MEEIRSNAGQGLGIAGLVLGILAIPMGIIPCTFYLGILFGIVGIVLSLVALTQANRGDGPKTLIVAALICSIVGLTLASVWGFVFSRDGARVVNEIIREEMNRDDNFDRGERGVHEVLRDLETDTTTWPTQSPDMQEMTDSLQLLEEEQE
jgi:hypothetical protein